MIVRRTERHRPEPLNPFNLIEDGAGIVADCRQFQLDLGMILESHGTLRATRPGGVGFWTPRSTRPRGV
jgi:hypothetical protein